MKRIKIPRLFNPKKVLAATARRASAASAGMDFDGIPEPNMKLSRALLIVLLLHVVAVSDEQAKTPSASGKTYIVKKGDNPVAIAKKLKVSYNDLIALNHIDDPRKLQIGQKLLVPKTTSSKTTSAKPSNQKKSKK